MPEREEDEAKGVEMEGDFEGDLVDLPSDAEEDDEEGEQNENKDEEQRLDQEMGDVGEQGQVPFLTFFLPLSCVPAQQSSGLSPSPSESLSCGMKAWPPMCKSQRFGPYL